MGMEYRSVGYEGILGGISSYPYIGKEKRFYTGEKGIVVYVGEYDDVRVLLKKEGKFVSGLHIKEMNGMPYVESAITIESERRKGHARKLFNYAKKYFKTNINHSPNLSELGKLFAENVK